MNNIDTRPPFFPRSRANSSPGSTIANTQNITLRKNNYERAKELEAKTQKDARVNIPDKIKDFSQIKRIADTSTPIDNSAKIADLKARIQAGTYEVDYDAVADKMLSTEY